jgi:hypothetical protein
VLSQTFINLTNLIENSRNIYDTKLILIYFEIIFKYESSNINLATPLFPIKWSILKKFDSEQELEVR